MNPIPREMHVTVDTNEEGTIRLMASCGDEDTALYITNPEMLGKTAQHYVDSMDEWAPLLLQDHVAQCVSCATYNRKN